MIKKSGENFRGEKTTFDQREMPKDKKNNNIYRRSYLKLPKSVNYFFLFIFL